MLVIGDVCMCEYTDRRHCGIVEQGGCMTTTVALLAQTAPRVRAGADMVAPST
jgi:porphobilinogen synthase